MIRQELISRYYHEPEGLILPEYHTNRRPSGIEVVEGTAGPFLPLDGLDEREVSEALYEISRSLRVVEYNGSYFEIATVNEAVRPRYAVMLHISTYNSSISSNPGNAIELAAQAVRFPQFVHLYVASPGNGATSPLADVRGGERTYASQTGRFTREQEGRTVGLPTFQNLYRALEKEGLTVTRLMGTDSAGGNYAPGLAVSMEPGQLDAAFFSERSGFVNLSLPRIVGGMAIELFWHNWKNNRISPDPERMTGNKKTQAVEALEAYRDLPTRQTVNAHQLSLGVRVSSLWATMQALRRGSTSTESPLVEDINTLLRHHPNARLTFGMAENDPLYINPERCHAAARAFLAELAIQNTPVRIVFLPGMTHSYKTWFPDIHVNLTKDALFKKAA